MKEIDFALLKVKYNKAIKDGEKSFILYGQEILVAYAKYLIEYENDKRK